MQRDSMQNTFIVATSVCVFWSVLVSTAAVVLRPAQEANKVEERKRNILLAAGLYDKNQPLDELFQQVEAKIVDLATGQYMSESEVDPDQFDQRASAKDPEMSVPIAPENDKAKIKQREKYSFVYLVEKDGKLDQVVLPINGKGLWSTLYGFVSLGADMRTIRGITFYEHGETPGLGGEVTNDGWRAQWNGRLAFAADGEVKIEVIRGMVDPGQETAVHQVDGLAGATITSRGVSNLVQYWLGEDGFGPFLDEQKES